MTGPVTRSRYAYRRHPWEIAHPVVRLRLHRNREEFDSLISYHSLVAHWLVQSPDKRQNADRNCARERNKSPRRRVTASNLTSRLKNVISNWLNRPARGISVFAPCSSTFRWVALFGLPSRQNLARKSLERSQNPKHVFYPPLF